VLNQRGCASLVSLLSANLKNTYNQIHYLKYSSVCLKRIEKGLNMPTQKKEKSTHVRFGSCAQYGVTLVELMVVVIIVGLLATLIFPSFKQHILATRRGDGVTHLLRLKIQQEAFRIENVRYAKTEQLGLPTSEYFTYVVTDVSATTYTITAKAKGSQMADQRCLAMQIDQSLNKTPSHCFL
jgi:type IV pilus assembly protein PilE